VNPLLAPRATRRNLDVVLFTSDRGLCGAYNSNLIKQAMAVIGENVNAFETITVIAVGKRGRDFFRRRRVNVPRAWTGLSSPTQEHAQEIAAYLIERYLSGESDRTVFVTARFVSALTQTPTVVTALPISAVAPASEGAAKLAYEIEPDAESLLGRLLPSVVEFMVLRALFEQAASEHGARMTAMDSATENTRELIRSLTLDMNKARQAQITTELTEIVAGSEAL
jgi:F-type H+-transporting ATPase subunit gamma